MAETNEITRANELKGPQVAGLDTRKVTPMSQDEMRRQLQAIRAQIQELKKAAG
jgi:hypothetical protein